MSRHSGGHFRHSSTGGDPWWVTVAVWVLVLGAPVWAILLAIWIGF